MTTRYSFHHMPEPARAFAEMRRICRLGGRIVVIDVTPSAEAQRAYDEMERLRDPSHVNALTLEQLRRLGRDAGLTERLIDGYRLAALLASVADERDMETLTGRLDADILSGANRTGVGAWRAEDGLRFCFPVSIVVWRA